MPTHIIYGDIQNAVDAASAGDTINVAAGTYTPNRTITNFKEGLTLVSTDGAASTVIQTPPDGSTMRLDAVGLLIGRMGQGFTVYGDIAVPTGVDASTIHINWNDILGTVTKNGLGTLDASYNWWGGAYPRTRTSGPVDYTTYLHRWGRCWGPWSTTALVRMPPFSSWNGAASGRPVFSLPEQTR